MPSRSTIGAILLLCIGCSGSQLERRAETRSYSAAASSPSERLTVARNGRKVSECYAEFHDPRTGPVARGTCSGRIDIDRLWIHFRAPAPTREAKSDAVEGQEAPPPTIEQLKLILGSEAVDAELASQGFWWDVLEVVVPLGFESRHYQPQGNSCVARGMQLIFWTRAQGPVGGRAEKRPGGRALCFSHQGQGAWFILSSEGSLVVLYSM